MMSLGENLVRIFHLPAQEKEIKASVGQSVLRRIWCELCKAVGWMHGVGLVHRDIKLESKRLFIDK